MSTRTDLTDDTAYCWPCEKTHADDEVCLSNPAAVYAELRDCVYKLGHDFETPYTLERDDRVRLISKAQLMLATLLHRESVRITAERFKVASPRPGCACVTTAAGQEIPRHDHCF